MGDCCFNDIKLVFFKAVSECYDFHFIKMNDSIIFNNAVFIPHHK